jgi:hypothetical protein
MSWLIQKHHALVCMSRRSEKRNAALHVKHEYNGRVPQRINTLPIYPLLHHTHPLILLFQNHSEPPYISCSSLENILKVNHVFSVVPLSRNHPEFMDERSNDQISSRQIPCTTYTSIALTVHSLICTGVPPPRARNRLSRGSLATHCRKRNANMVIPNKLGFRMVDCLTRAPCMSIAPASALAVSVTP